LTGNAGSGAERRAKSLSGSPMQRKRFAAVCRDRQSLAAMGESSVCALLPPRAKTWKIAAEVARIPRWQTCRAGFWRSWGTSSPNRGEWHPSVMTRFGKTHRGIGAETRMRRQRYARMREADRHAVAAYLKARDATLHIACACAGRSSGFCAEAPTHGQAACRLINAFAPVHPC
jgi:hypothetical protein